MQRKSRQELLALKTIVKTPRPCVVCAFQIHIVAGDSRFNRQIPLNASLEAIYVHHMHRDTDYKIQMAAVSRKGAGIFSDLIVIG